MKKFLLTLFIVGLITSPHLLSAQNSLQKKKGFIPVKIFLLSEDTYWDADPNNLNDLIPVTRYIPKTKAVAKKTLELLFLGPTDEETKKHYLTEIPFESKLRSIKIMNGVVSVDFNASVEEGRQGVTTMINREKQIRKTLLQFPSIKSVKISVEGRTEDIFPAGE